ncbi:MAG: GAF domain-containing protein [Candidatus Limnocylindrales bacterium]
MKTARDARRASLQEALATLGGLLEASQALAVHDAPEMVLQLIADRVRTLVNARYAALGIVGRDGRLERFVTSGLDAATRAHIGDLPQGHGLLGLIISDDRSIRIDDIGADPRRYGFPAHHPPMHDFLGVPVHVQGRSVGNLYLTDKRGGHFDADDQRLVEAFAIHAGIAIENARMSAQIDRLAILAERERISTDLHDGLIQDIYGVSLNLEDAASRITDPEVVSQLDRAIDRLHQTIGDVRNFIYSLQPDLLEGSGLVAGLAIVAEEARHNTLLDVVVEAPASPIAEPAPGVTADLLAIASEALSNVARHAHATHARLAAGDDGQGVWLTITDDGIGMQVSTPSLGHQGVRNMRQRAERLGGTVKFQPRDGGGTIVEVWVPRVAPDTGGGP